VGLRICVWHHHQQPEKEEEEDSREEDLELRRWREMEIVWGVQKREKRGWREMLVVGLQREPAGMRRRCGQGKPMVMGKPMAMAMAMAMEEQPISDFSPHYRHVNPRLGDMPTRDRSARCQSSQ
jgi:hypothetical protein